MSQGLVDIHHPAQMGWHSESLALTIPEQNCTISMNYELFCQHTAPIPLLILRASNQHIPPPTKGRQRLCVSLPAVGGSWRSFQATWTLSGSKELDNVYKNISLTGSLFYLPSVNAGLGLEKFSKGTFFFRKKHKMLHFSWEKTSIFMASYFFFIILETSDASG